MTNYRNAMSERIKSTLERAKFPTDVLVLDFETYFTSTYSLKKMSIPEYVADKRFEVVGVAWKLNSAPPKFTRTLPPIPNPITIVGQNLIFDATVLAMRYRRFPRYMIDTRSLSMYQWPRFKKHGLKDISQRLGLTPKGDTLRFRDLHADDVWDGRENQRLMTEYAIDDARITFDAFEQLLPEIEVPELELPLIHHTVTLATEPVLEWDSDSAKGLKVQMLHEKQTVLDTVSWVHDAMETLKC